MQEMLQQNRDIFVWSALDIPGIPSSIITHDLNVNHRAIPVRQKKRKFTADCIEAVEEEVGKLLKAEYIREVKYPDWLSNVVMVKKTSGKWRMCVDLLILIRPDPNTVFLYRP